MTDPGPIPPRFERFEGTEGLSLAADVLGDDDRPTVLLAHGGGQTRHAWGGAALALALRGWRAVSLDQRGHGDSDRSPEGRYLIEHFGAALRAVAGGLDRPVAVGASLGGIASLIAEGESPEPVLRAVVLVDITPRVRPEGAARVVDFMKAHVETGFGSLEEAADAVAAYLPNRRRPRDLSGLRKNL
ncbi:MAG: alpha/beta hydrolase, partial [Alphaproteobacteria bacterium]|nr:alpha/beta hydrolase [Alphaproteobacteria bacterium]